METDGLNLRMQAALQKRMEDGLFRQLNQGIDPIKSDFISNDYLSLGRQSLPENWLKSFPEPLLSGSGGSRLVSGNYAGLESLENRCSQDLRAESCLFFPTGFMANLAVLSCLGSRHDTYIYDEQCHVSLKDGMRLSLAAKKSFTHNQPEDLLKKLKTMKGGGTRFVVVEAIYSMDGDVCPLPEILKICQEYDAHLILDEAHSTGTLGKEGMGLAIDQHLQQDVFCRIYTFGKALGAAGAVIAGNNTLKDFLINYAHPFIYSTAPMPLQVALCHHQWKKFRENPQAIYDLQMVISIWNQKVLEIGLKASSNFGSPVQYISCQGNKEAKWLETKLQNLDIQIKAMISPTVPIGKERLRVSLHRHNNEQEIDHLLGAVAEIKNNFGTRI